MWLDSHGGLHYCYLPLLLQYGHNQGGNEVWLRANCGWKCNDLDQAKAMTTLVFTAHDKAYSELAQLTVPRMRDYAFRHGYRFVCYAEPLADIPNAIYWSGVLGAAPNLERYDRVMYLDVDQLITNPALSIEDLIGPATSGFHASKDWGVDAVKPWQFSMCGWVAYKDCIPLLEQVYFMEPAWRDKPFPEQGPFQEAVKQRMQSGIGLITTIHPRKTFNAVPEQVSLGNVPEPWQLGDFACHITMLSIDDRIKLAKEIYEQTKSMGKSTSV